MLVLNLITLCIVVITYRKVNLLARQTSDLLEPYLEEEQEIYSDEQETSSQEDLMYEEFLAERQAKFDERIMRIKDELDTRPAPSIAEVLHPMVENLPHDSIPDYDTNLPSVEYAD